MTEVHSSCCSCEVKSKLEVSKQSYSGESCQQTDMKQGKMKQPSPNYAAYEKFHM